jgi:hypothetical protein
VSIAVPNSRLPVVLVEAVFFLFGVLFAGIAGVKWQRDVPTLRVGPGDRALCVQLKSAGR